MKTKLAAMIALATASTPVFAAATRLECKFREFLNQPAHTPPKEVAYELNLDLDAKGNGHTGPTAAKLLHATYAVTTFVSTNVAPGQQLVIITTTDTATKIQTSAGGAVGSIAFFDSPEGDLNIDCKTL